MQTFLPYDSYALSAFALDDYRLRNQRNECKVILKTLLGHYPVTEKGQPGGWPNHPATKMWKGYEYALCEYALKVCRMAVVRGWEKGDLTDFFKSEQEKLEDTGDPPWMGREDFHLSHRSNLVRKRPDYYGKMWPDVPSTLPYIWPEGEENGRHHTEGEGALPLPGRGEDRHAAEDLEGRDEEPGQVGDPEGEHLQPGAAGPVDRGGD